MYLFQFIIAASVVFGAFIPARAGEAKAKVAGVRYSSDFECGLNHRVQAIGGAGTADDPARFSIQFPHGRQQGGYFLFRLDGVAGKTVRVDIHTDRAPNWKTLNPVFAPIDPLIDKHGNDTDAILAAPILYTAKPPPDLGSDFELPRGLGGSDLPLTHGIFQVWQYMPRSGVNPGKEQNVFRVEHTFTENQNTVLVAMKVPYTPKLSNRLMNDLKERWDKENAESRRSEPDWEVVEVGKSAEGRPLWLVRIGEAVERDPDQPMFAPPPEDKRSRRPCILFYAREHADEHDTSWLAQGVVEFLLSNNRDARAIRDQMTVLVVPLLDPDGAAENQYETDVIMGFEDEPGRPPEVLAWAEFFQNWINAGNRLDLVFNIHNVESGEGPHLFVYVNDPERPEISQELHKTVARQLGDAYTTRSTNRIGWVSTRLGGWLRRTYGTHQTFYEVNSQAPKRHLSLYELKALGPNILIGAIRYLRVSDSFALRRQLQEMLVLRYRRQHRYYDLDQLFDPEESVFDQEATLDILEAIELHFHDNDQRPNWLNPLYKRIDSGELSPLPSWRN